LALGFGVAALLTLAVVREPFFFRRVEVVCVVLGVCLSIFVIDQVLLVLLVFSPAVTIT
jgi:hypothetical protein